MAKGKILNIAVTYLWQWMKKVLYHLYQYGKPVTAEDGSTDLEIYCAHYFCLLFSPGKSWLRPYF
jgi:hypothetical protein